MIITIGFSKLNHYGIWGSLNYQSSNEGVCDFQTELLSL